MANDSFDGIRPGVYNVDYFNGSQVAAFIGDVFVEEVTAINFVVQQNRRPIYGYADQHFKAMSKGQILVQGQFAINFKEAGYMWLILNEYRQKMKGLQNKLDQSPVKSSSASFQQSIEQVINGEVKQEDRYKSIGDLSQAYASLAGFASTTRAAGKRKGEGEESVQIVGDAENIFEAFENYVWGNKKDINGYDVSENRSADDTDLNPFDIYLTYGDFSSGHDEMNHTVIKLEDCYIIGTAQRVEIDPLPIMEIYSFVAKMRV